VSQSNALAGTTGNMYYPADIQAGDLAILLEYSRSNTSGTIPPQKVATGYTLIATQASPTDRSVREQMSYKILDAADVSAGFISAGLDSNIDAKNVTIMRGYDASGTVPALFTSVALEGPAKQGSNASAPGDQVWTVSALDGKSALFATYCSAPNNIVGASNSLMLQNAVDCEDRQLVAGQNYYTGLMKSLAGGNAITCRLTDTGEWNMLQSFIITAT
jgi:hypothetical protein